MDRTLKLASKTSNEIFMLRYPRSVLEFCDYDLAYFAENAISVCNEALKNGEIDIDRTAELRNSIKGAHVYIEHHLRTTYEKIVLDCWIDYVCRRDNVGTASLWNRFAACRSAFEREVFTRLCDFRYNRAINEWLNLVRVQDYAKNKISFVFSKQLSGAEEAASRRNYFDLMFSVTAQELGCKLDELGVTKVYTLGRVPSAPFMFPTISKDIIKNVLSELDYSEDYSHNDYSSELSDQIAMDAFSRMKRSLAGEFESYNISRSQMMDNSPKVYMPCGLKAAVDLEIDALIESGGWLARCKRCGRYFLRDAEHMEEYCSLFTPGSKTCLEIFELEHPKTLFTSELERECREVTDVMYERIDRDMSLEEYESWRAYLNASIEKVKNGEISADELKDFLRYSRSVDLSRSNPLKEAPRREKQAPRERVVKPFVPERIERSALPEKPKREEEDIVERAARREGFFISPSVQRQKTERSPVSHIIRAGEQPSEKSGEFIGFAESAASKEAPKRYAEERVFEGQSFKSEYAMGATVDEKDFAKTDEPRAGEIEKPEEAAPPPAAQPRVIKKNAAAISAYGKMSGAAFASQLEQISRPNPADMLKEVSDNESADERITKPQAALEPDPDPFKDVGGIFDVLEQSDGDMNDLIPYDEPAFDTNSESASQNVREPQKAPAEERSARSQQTAKAPKNRFKKTEPSPEWEQPAREDAESEQSVPSGFWTEERHLFPENEAESSELDMLKEKKRGRSNKTRRLYDALMKEPEDNPNFRKKR